MRWLVFAVLLGCSANDSIPAPLISALNPNHGPPGAVVMITGQYFCQQPVGEDPACDANATAQFGSVPGIISAYTDTAIMVEVPDGITGKVSVTVTAAGKTSNGVTFTAE